MKLREHLVEPGAFTPDSRPLQYRDMQRRPARAVSLKSNEGVLGTLQLLVDPTGRKAGLGSIPRR